MKKIYGVIFALLLSVFLVSCKVVLVDVEASETIKHYTDNLVARNYKEAYSLLHPGFKKKISLSEFVEKAKNSESKIGQIQALKINKEILVKGKEDFVYEVTIAYKPKMVKYKIEVVKLDDKWVISAIHPFAEKILTEENVAPESGVEM